MLHFHIVTLFPDSIEPYLQSSIIGRAREKKLVKISYYDPKKYTRDKYGRVDRRPYGGGPGMVLEPDAVLRAADAALRKAKPSLTKPVIIFFTTAGEQFDEPMVQKLAKVSKNKTKHIIMICGRYEGVDARVQKILRAKAISMGPYVLTGGELPAAIVVDAVARFVPGVLGKIESLEASRASSPDVYTRPEILEWKKKNYRVPAVLLTGNHKEIDAWRTANRSSGSDAAKDRAEK